MSRESQRAMQVAAPLPAVVKSPPARANRRDPSPGNEQDCLCRCPAGARPSHPNGRYDWLPLRQRRAAGVEVAALVHRQGRDIAIHPATEGAPTGAIPFGDIVDLDPTSRSVKLPPT